MKIAGDDKKLRVLGIVDSRLLFQFLNKDVGGENALWVFIDFSSYDLPLGFQFEYTGFEGNQSRLDTTIIKLTSVYDSFGHNLKDGIPKGFKTVCELTFHPAIPARFRNLPSLTGWQPTKEAIDLTSLQSTKFKEEISPQVLEMFLHMFYVNDLSGLKSTSIGKSEFYDILSSKYFNRNNDFHSRMNEIMRLLVSKGFVKQDEDQEKLVIQ